LSARRLVRGALACLLLALAGCGMQPMAFPTSPSELGERPGLLTGETGAVTICCHATPAPTPVKPAE
jgi:hypothetical protein